MKDLLPNNTTILLKKVVHKNDIRLLLLFHYNDEIINKIKNLNKFIWSRTLKGWHTSFNKEDILLVQESLRNMIEFIYDDSLYESIKIKPSKKNRVLTSDDLLLTHDFVKYLDGKYYSKSTITTYSNFIVDFVEYKKNKPLNELTNRDVEKFIEDIMIPKRLSVSTHRQFISAMKIFIQFYPDTQIEELQLQRPKKSRLLPIVLSQEEIIDLLRHTKNLKHRAILALLYSAGLRIGELINLELRNINIDRRQIVVKNGKGRKDRYVILAESFLPLLQNYVITYKPKRYFAEGKDGEKYTASSIRKFLYRSCVDASITKKVTPHTLRHSYATHLLENGIGLRHIQELLGHAKPETTMIYTHVAKKDLLDIKSPLDIILASLSKNGKKEQKFLLSRHFK